MAVDPFPHIPHDSTENLDARELIEKLRRATRAVDARLVAVCESNGIDAPSFDVLRALLSSGSPFCLTPAELAREARITTSAVAQRLNRLESRGLVSRQAHPVDKRSTVVALTNRGKEVAERTLPEVHAAEQQILAGLSKDGLDILRRLLNHLEQA